jgi:hypothetical protein
MENIEKSDSNCLDEEFMEIVLGRMLGKFKEPLPSLPLFYEELMNLGDEETVLAKLIDFYVRTRELEAKVPEISPEDNLPAKRKRVGSSTRKSKRRRRN